RAPGAAPAGDPGAAPIPDAGTGPAGVPGRRYLRRTRRAGALAGTSSPAADPSGRADPGGARRVAGGRRHHRRPVDPASRGPGGGMMAATLFSLAFPLAAPFWALMILAPAWSWTWRVVSSPLIVLGPLGVYAVLVLTPLPTVLPAVTHPTPASVPALLVAPVGPAAGWAPFIGL